MARSIAETIAATKASRARTRTITVPERVSARPAEPGKYRVAFLVYRGNPTCGGQGVYTRHLTRELVALGHSVEVFSGQPWPELDAGVGFTPVPGLDLYRNPDPFRMPAPSEFNSLADVAEFGVMMSSGFGEPLAYSLRLKKLLDARRDEFDIVHDDQCMGWGILRLYEARLAAARDSSSPHYRGPLHCPRPRRHVLEASEYPSLVRVPAHADTGGQATAGHPYRVA